MFLPNLFSAGGKIVPLETLPSVRCPLCGRPSAVRLFRADHTLRALGVTVLRRQARAFAVCAACGGVFDAQRRDSGLG